LEDAQRAWLAEQIRNPGPQILATEINETAFSKQSSRVLKTRWDLGGGAGGVPTRNAVFSLPCGGRLQPDPSSNEQHSLLALQQCPQVSINKV